VVGDETTIIGRGRELAQLLPLVAEERLVTITGTPGVGKSRLARALLAELHADSATPSHWCDVAEVASADDLGLALAAQLGFSSVDSMLLALVDQRAVVVFDGCDRALPELRDLVGLLLQECRDLRVVTTSRQPLGVVDETVWVLAPLPVPEDDALADDDWQTNESVRLYLDRSASAGVPSPETSEDLRTIASLVRELDGLPLAIELAARRGRSLGPGDLLARVDRRLDLLDRSNRDATLGTVGLRAALDVSYEDLHPDAQLLLRRLSVFRGPVAADLVHLVCGEASWDEVHTLDLLGELVDRSLVETRRWSGGTVRYRLLNLIRQYASHQLDGAGEREQAEQRCIDALVGMADTFAADASREWSQSLIARMLGCYATLIGTIELCIDRDEDGRRAFRLFLPLYSAIHGPKAGEVASVGSRLLARWPAGDEPWRAEVSAVVALAHLLAGDTPTAVELAGQAKANDTGGPLVDIIADRTLAFAAHYDGRTDLAVEYIEQAIASAANWGGPFERELRVVRAALRSVDDGAWALRELDEVIRSSAVSAESLNQMWAMVVAAHVLTRDGRRVEARVMAAEALQLADALEHGWGRGASRRVLALLDTYDHGWERAQHLWRVALDDVVLAGDRGGAALTIEIAAAAAADLGRDGPATTLRSARVEGAAQTILPPMSPTSPIFGGSDRASPSPVAGIVSFSSSIRRARAVFAEDDHVDAVHDPTVDARVPHGPALVRDGDLWSITFGGTAVSVRHAKGLDDLAKLLAAPHLEMHCLDLMGAGVVETDTGPSLDATARRAYEDRIRELQSELDEATANHDTAREELVVTELDALVEQLSQAVGVGGRSRPTNTTVERARAAVRWRLRAVIERLESRHPALGRHLDRSVRTGVWCVYAPEDPATWHVDATP
jgi:predicted ATPase